MKQQGMILFREWWWVIVVCALTLAFYSQAMRARNATLRELTFRLEGMKRERFFAFLEKEDLQLQIASHNDPSWIELILMRDLGVVPEGWLKVHFKR